MFMGIQKQFILRYKSDGHIRFQIPERICHPKIAKRIETAILNIEGVYRVKLFTKQQKLSIRFLDHVCDFTLLVQRLSKTLIQMEQQNQLTLPEIQPVKSTASTWKFKSTVKNWKASRWVNNKYNDIKETAQAAKTITKLGLKKPNAFIKNPEKTIIDFLNDVLVLYLIKIHWPRITQEWLPKPWVHRYHWLAVFYMFYLLMRSRRPQ